MEIALCYEKFIWPSPPCCADRPESPWARTAHLTYSKRGGMYPIAGRVSLLGLAALAAGAHASTVYDVVAGSSSYITLQVYASNGTTLLASGSNTLPLTAPTELSVDYSGSNPTDIPTFTFEDMGVTSIGLSNGDRIQVTNAMVTPGSPYSSSVAGSGSPYNYSLGGLSGSVSSYTLFNSSNTPLISGGPISGSTTGPLTGSITINGDSSITLNGIVLGTMTNGDMIKADVIFEGAPVPLPPTIALLAPALLGLGMVSLRRRPLTRMSFDSDSRRPI
jgi:hypothetical protein